MLSRRQMLARSLALLCTPSPLVKLNQESKVGEGIFYSRYGYDIPYYRTLRDMVIHKIIRHSPGAGHIYAGQAWACRRWHARKYLDEYYAKHYLLPRGIHTVPSSNHPRVINFDVLTQTLKADIESANLSDYPEWTGVTKIRELSA
jgi:hypothetical protein